VNIRQSLVNKIPINHRSMRRLYPLIGLFIKELNKEPLESIIALRTD